MLSKQTAKTTKTSKKRRCFEVLEVFAVQRKLEVMG
jgi:hypothetical protein